ncbi:hypothetical protein OHB26_39440 (plasmid) [Nocardia sp. NBC_01503]|uniref:hypothetical protein n=1 Tax=Nocardia sp. NBC_01503 TaxID=2975997 RepID=UPI002E7C51D2|nr:hypothetical protein [Nocardia sp. NBC_01503]WTL36694.1 hypothetical protein OHB26_39135 [Nocardia sp. NBC_01503]WTL36753.1 hypothetical protein OHB26_39440 [Nocardia sp. NBC_01503]
MSIAVASWVAQSSMWQVLWTVLVLSVAVVVIALTAVLRANREDVPKVFAAFAHAFGLHRPKDIQPEPVEPSQPDTDTVPATEEQE